MPDRPRQSALRRTLAVAAGLWTGLALLELFFLYLATASIWCQVKGLPETGPGSPYLSWPLKVLVALLAANMIAATIRRMPIRLADLGGLAAHLGVVVLAIGASWYVLAGSRGQAVAERIGRSDAFTVVDRFFIEGSDAMYVSPVPGGLDVGRQTPLARDLPSWRLSSAPQPVATPFEDLSVEAVESVPSAQIAFDWRDGGPAPAPAVDVTIQDGPHEFQRLICPSYPFTRQAEIGGYVLRLGEGPAGGGQAATQLAATQPAATTAPPEGKDVVVISRQDPQAVLTVTAADGKTARHTTAWGRPVLLTLAGRQVGLTVERFYSRAWRGGAAQQAAPGAGVPAVKIEMRVGDWHGSQWVGYDPTIRPIRLEDPDLQAVPLPGGRWAAFHLAPQSARLPEPVTIERWEYQTWPASSIPRDYVCDLRVGDPAGGAGRTVTCRLNQPARIGSVRLYQGSWLPDAENPARIVFHVASRPGIWAVWAGCLLVCLAMPYAFYVKPWLKRRRGGAA